jgi:hypothetical protein
MLGKECEDWSSVVGDDFITQILPPFLQCATFGSFQCVSLNGKGSPILEALEIECQLRNLSNISLYDGVLSDERENCRIGIKCQDLRESIVQSKSPSIFESGDRGHFTQR